MANRLALVALATLASAAPPGGQGRGGGHGHGGGRGADTRDFHGGAGRHDGHIKVNATTDRDLHPRKWWHNAHNAHDYEVVPDPEHLPPYRGFVGPQSNWARHAHYQALAGGSSNAAFRGRRLVAGPGETTSSECTATYCGGRCCMPNAANTPMNSANTVLSLSYNTTTGYFNGSILTNQCPYWPADFQYNGTVISHPTTPSCIR